ncbi:hypothetical protein ACFW5I_34280 [Streptomyces sp. NPDC058818]|uniref:hypothetical protein n=1 Tax=Streptomyces sp. NPDC058818 TaxID=3346640 RepID=UPI0036BD3BE0
MSEAGIRSADTLMLGNPPPYVLAGRSCSSKVSSDLTPWKVDPHPASVRTHASDDAKNADRRITGAG